MALNLRRKVPKSSKLIICELVESQVDKFLKEAEHQDKITVASTPKEVAEQAVSKSYHTMSKHHSHRKEYNYHNAPQRPSR